MKKCYRFVMTLCMVIAGFAASASALDQLYIVGNLTDWKAPIAANADFYENFKLQNVGEYQGYPILYGSFDVSNLDVPPMFRFYSALESWEYNSYGSQYNDVPIDYSLEKMESGLQLKLGKGSFNIPDWSGNTLYITVWNSKVWASNSNYFDPTDLPLINGSETMSACQGDQGVYSVYSGIASANIRVKGSTVGRPDKEWLYVAPKADFEADNYGIAICDFDLSETPVNFDCPLTPWHSFRWLYVDCTNKKLYANIGLARWLKGSFNQCPKITFQNYKNYDQYLLKLEEDTKFITEIPEGNVSLALDSPSFGMQYDSSSDWNAKQNPSKYYEDGEFYSINWPGGNLICSYYYLGWIKSFDEMYVWNSREDPSPIKLEPTAPGVFEAIVSLPALGDASMVYVLFQNYNIEGPALQPNFRNYFFTDEDKVINAQYEIFPYSRYAYFNQFPDGAKMKVSVDSNSNKISYTVIDGDIQNIPLVWYHYNKAADDEDGWVEMDRYDRYTFVRQIPSYMNNEISKLRIQLSNGQVLIPDWNVASNNGFGITSYPFSLVSGNEIPDDAFLPISEDFNSLDGNTIFQVNLDKKELTIFKSDEAFSDKSVENGFLLPKRLYMYAEGFRDGNDYNEFNGEPFKFNFDNSCDNLLNLTSYDADNECGVYEGRFSLVAGAAQYVHFYALLFPLVDRYIYSPGISIDYNNQYFNPGMNDTFEAEGIIENYGRVCNIDTTDLPSNDYGIRVTVYGKDHVNVWVGNGATTVAEYEMDLTALQAVGQRGAILLNAFEPTEVNVYSINGSLVRSLNVPAGATTLDGFLPGLYIVNGQKVLVR